MKYKLLLLFIVLETVFFVGYITLEKGRNHLYLESAILSPIRHSLVQIKYDAENAHYHNIERVADSLIDQINNLKNFEGVIEIPAYDYEDTSSINKINE